MLLIGVGIVIPVFFTNPVLESVEVTRVMLSFSVIEQENVDSWCNALGEILEEEDVDASIFFSGQIIEKNPKLLDYFGNSVDIGSQTFSYVDLTSVDFEVQLDEVKKGKQVIDQFGNLNSCLFKAPYGKTDENIYYLLSQAGITADFSYDAQYNLYENGLFIKYDAIVCDGSVYDFDLIDASSETVHIVNFDNSDSVQHISQVILSLKESGVNFVKASEIAGTDLTRRIN